MRYRVTLSDGRYLAELPAPFEARYRAHGWAHCLGEPRPGIMRCEPATFATAEDAAEAWNTYERRRVRLGGALPNTVTVIIGDTATGYGWEFTSGRRVH